MEDKDMTTSRWVPQGELIIMSSKPLRLNDVKPENLIKVKNIEWTPVPKFCVHCRRAH